MPEAIADARKNAKLNGINNATFVQGDLNKINESFGKEFPKPDIIISGSHGSYNATVLWHSNFDYVMMFPRKFCLRATFISKSALI